MDYSKESLKLHKELKGKFSIKSKVRLETKDDLSLAYTPGVGAVSKFVAEDIARAYDYTSKGNMVAVVSDGSAVLGLGNLGPEGALPVMEGKAILFKEFADIDAIPLVLKTQDVNEIIMIVKNIAPGFGGINLEDISAPRCFEIEQRLQDIGIPVFHDDQHGTAIVVLAGIINSMKVLNKDLSDLEVVLNGAGAAGFAIAKILSSLVKDIVVCDSKGIISEDRSDLNPVKQKLLSFTNKNNISGSLSDAVIEKDVFIGVSKAGLLNEELIRKMNPEPVVFALANPIPEIMPTLAKEIGVSIIATGRSDFPNQVNNVLAFPGIFKGALSIKASRITEKMKLAAAYAIANHVKNPTKDNILPSPLDKSVADAVAEAVKNN